MNVTEARDAMYGLLRTAWLASATTSPVPLYFDGVKFEKPGSDADGNALPYAVASVRHTGGTQETIGGQGLGKMQHVGALVVQIFTAEGFGCTLGDALAQVAKSSLQGQRFGAGWFANARVIDLAVDPANATYRLHNVVADFFYEEGIGE